jgi:proteic killer suppression protein
MLRSFRNKGLQELFETGKSAKIDKRMQSRIIRRLDALDAAKRVGDVALPGFEFHPLEGFNPTRYSLHVNGPWCITFEFDGEDAVRVDFEQYH